MSVRSLVLAAALLGTSASAQPSGTPASHPQVWVDGGSTVLINPLWVGAGVGLGVEFEQTSVRVGLSTAQPFWGITDVNALAITGGVHREFEPFRLSAHAGPAVVWGTDGDRPGERPGYVVAGAVVGASAKLMLGRYIRLGVDGSVTVNSVETAAAAGPSLQVLLWR